MYLKYVVIKITFSIVMRANNENLCEAMRLPPGFSFMFKKNIVLRDFLS